MKSVLVLIVCFSICILPCVSFASSCSGSDYDKAEYYAIKAGETVVSKFGGGHNIRVHMESCSYNSYSRNFNVNISIYWDGVVFHSNKYHMNGDVSMDSNGNGAEFKEAYANDQVEELRSFRKWAGGIIGGVIVLGALSNSQNSNN